MATMASFVVRPRSEGSIEIVPGMVAVELVEDAGVDVAVDEPAVECERGEVDVEQ
jgi:hypothetical protein